MIYEYLALPFQALDRCQLGDEVRRKELRLDSPGPFGSLHLDSFLFLFRIMQFKVYTW